MFKNHEFVIRKYRIECYTEHEVLYNWNFSVSYDGVFWYTIHTKNNESTYLGATFDTEIYSQNKEDSWVKHITKEGWYQNFFLESVKICKC